MQRYGKAFKTQKKLLSQNEPKIQVFTHSAKLKLALLDLTEFSAHYALEAKREIEKKGALYLVRRVLDNDTLEITYAKSGKPLLDTGVKISISHSYEKLAVLFSFNEEEVGVDIEQVRDKIMKITTKFLSTDELKELEGTTYEKYTLYWAAKEAIYKAAGIEGLIFAQQMTMDPFVLSHGGGKIMARLKHPASKKQFTLHYRLIEDYVLAYTDNQ
mgnify:CR=1 FL=1